MRRAGAWFGARRALVVVVAVAGAVRLAWVLYAARPPSLYTGGDPFAYLQYARQLADGEGYHSFLTGEPTAFQPPGWPMLLAAVFAVAFRTPLTDDTALLAGLVNVVAGTATVALVHEIGRRVSGPRAGLLAAWTVALWPNLVFYTGAAALETSFTALLLLAVALLLAIRWSAGGLPARPALAAGLVLGASALVRPFSVVVLAGVVVAGRAARVPWRAVARSAGLVAAGAALVLVPWTVRNAIVMDGFVPVSTNMGPTFCAGHHEGAPGSLVKSGRGCVQPRVAREAHDEVEQNRHAVRRGLAYFVSHPVDEVRLLFWRAFFTLEDDHDGLDAVESGGPRSPTAFIPGRPRAALVALADAWYYVVVGFALLGLVRFVRGRDPGRLLVAVTAAGLLAVPLELYGLPRFKAPLLPFLALFAAPAVLAAARASEPVA